MTTNAGPSFRRALLLGALLGLLAGPLLWWGLRRTFDPAARPEIDREALRAVSDRLRSAPEERSVYEDVAALLAPSVVSIHGPGLTARGELAPALGSGVIIDDRGHVLTNAHVVLDDLGRSTRSYQVVLGGYGAVEGRILGADIYTDLAVLEIRAEGLWPAALGDSDELDLGEQVMAVGTPFGLEGSVSLGIVSALGRSGLGLTPFENYIQTDAAINPGNSGGPLVNLRGEVVGINSAIRSETRQSAGIGFAIPVNTARYVAEELIASGRVRRGFLGIDQLTRDVATRSSGGTGVRVVSVVEGTPADRAGLRANDVITALDGRRVRSFKVLQDRIAHSPPGTIVRLTVLRDGAEREFEVTLGQRDEDG
jgi:S1-C subfamily serine protease